MRKRDSKLEEKRKLIKVELKTSACTIALVLGLLNGAGWEI